MGTKLAVAVPLPELLDAAREFVRLAAREVAPEHAHHRCALEKREIERQAGDGAGSEAHHPQAAAPRAGAARRPPGGPPDRGVSEDRAFSPGRRLDPLASTLA